MTWNPDPLVSINGVDYTNKSLNGVTVNFGRTSFWDQPRNSTASINIVNLTNSDFGFDINQTVLVRIKNSGGSYVTIFSGSVIEITNRVQKSGVAATSVIQTIRAVGPFAKMSRVLTGDDTWPKEYDSDRISRIFTASGLTVDTIDTPGVYEFQSKAVGPSDCYSFASKYAQMAFGYIYETRDGKIGFANESRRNSLITSPGYTIIPKNTIIASSVASDKSITDITNDIALDWRAGTETYSVASSIASYGKAGSVIQTELHNATDASFQAEKYGTLRATPRTNLNSFSIQLDASTVSNTLLDALIPVYIGMPVKLENLPMGIKNKTFAGFVESHTFSISENQVSLTINASDEVYSINPTRWQEVVATLKWSDVAPTLQWDEYQ